MTPLEIAYKTLIEVGNQACKTERFGEGDCRVHYSRTRNPPNKQREMYCVICKARHAAVLLLEEAKRILDPERLDKG
jgi:hypothetical protein